MAHTPEPTRCVILPGLDGSVELLGEFVAALRPGFAAIVLRYPRDRCMGYDELVEWVWPQLPTHAPFVLIGESFSGPVAIRVAARRPPQLSALVLCASFARAPRPPWSPWALDRWPRASFALPLQRAPTAIAARIMLGRWADRPWTARLRTVLNSLDPAVLRHRLREVAAVDAAAALTDIAAPLLYLRATRDLLVGADSARLIQRLRPNARCAALDAPHFVLQARADAAAACIAEWYAATVAA